MIPLFSATEIQCGLGTASRYGWTRSQRYGVRHVQRTTDLLIIHKFRMNTDVLSDQELHAFYCLPKLLSVIK